jgi:hypothetical protein
MTSIDGKRIGIPHSRSKTRVSCGSPPRTTAMSALVPPMSRQTTSRRPQDAATAAPAITPAAGPEFSVFTGAPLAYSVVIVPPPLCMTRTTSLLKPDSARAASSVSM